MIQPLIKHVIEPLVAHREGSDHLKELAKLERSQYFSPDRIAELQFERLRALLTYANDHCRFYARRLSEAGINPARITGPDDINSLPPITKRDIQNSTDDMLSDEYVRDMLVLNQTGGSTGAPLRFYVNRERFFSRKAATYRHDRWSGWDIGHKMGVLWGNRVDFAAANSIKARLRSHWYDRRLILDTSNITSENFAEFDRALNAYRPHVYLAYANAMFLFARYLKEKGGDYYRPRAVITSAELLTDEQRQLIQEVFDCPVFNRYGCRETSMIASECEHHQGMHIAAEHILLQIERPVNGDNTDTPGKIIVTDLLNFGQPLIRYQIEDMGIPVDGTCSCGRGLPMMKLAGGRVTDFLVTPDNRVVSGAAMTIYFVATVPGVAQAQLVQREKDFLVLRIVRNDRFGDDSYKKIAEKVQEFFGPDMRHDLEFVDAIPSTASGKHRFSISELDPMEYLV
ncbi:hypothetical protein GF377_01315 [candidate division GN15 bacterium]|nr:hypothetical protein [candidate division GN15 bacterium]